MKNPMPHVVGIHKQNKNAKKKWSISDDFGLIKELPTIQKSFQTKFATSTSILARVFSMFMCEVRSRVPLRRRHGHGKKRDRKAQGTRGAQPAL